MAAELPVPAVVLAGGKTRPDFALEAGTPERALADINGWPMVRYVLAALRAAEAVGKTVLVAPPGFPLQPHVDRHVTSDRGLVENIRAGLAACDGAAAALLVTSDIPFLTGPALDDHLRNCAAAGADCCYTGLSREACALRFPGMRRTYVHVGGQVLTGGNVVFQRLAAFDRQAALLERAYERRKNPLFLARLIGMANLFKLVARRLTLPDIEAAASRAMGVCCRIVLTPHAELATDVDHPEDLRMARKLLRPG